MTCSSSLRGYKEVENFGPDEDYEDEIEEEYVTLDLSGVDPTLVTSNSSFRLVGLETDAPFLQLSATVMKGRHEKLLGTELVFFDGSSSDHLAHVANIENRIRFKEVQLKPKKPIEDTAVQGQDVIEIDDNSAENPDNPGIVSKLLNNQSNSRRRGRYKSRKTDVTKEEAAEESITQDQGGSQEVAMDIDET